MAQSILLHPHHSLLDCCLLVYWSHCGVFWPIFFYIRNLAVTLKQKEEPTSPVLGRNEWNHLEVSPRGTESLSEEKTQGNKRVISHSWKVRSQIMWFRSRGHRAEVGLGGARPPVSNLLHSSGQTPTNSCCLGFLFITLLFLFISSARFLQAKDSIINSLWLQSRHAPLPHKIIWLHTDVLKQF